MVAIRSVVILVVLGIVIGAIAFALATPRRFVDVTGDGEPDAVFTWDSLTNETTSDAPPDGGGESGQVTGTFAVNAHILYTDGTSRSLSRESAFEVYDKTLNKAIVRTLYRLEAKMSGTGNFTATAVRAVVVLSGKTLAGPETGRTFQPLVTRYAAANIPLTPNAFTRVFMAEEILAREIEVAIAQTFSQTDSGTSILVKFDAAMEVRFAGDPRAGPGGVAEIGWPSVTVCWDHRATPTNDCAPGGGGGGGGEPPVPLTVTGARLAVRGRYGVGAAMPDAWTLANRR